MTDENHAVMKQTSLLPSLDEPPRHNPANASATASTSSPSSESQAINPVEAFVNESLSHLRHAATHDANVAWIVTALPSGHPSGEQIYGFRIIPNPETAAEVIASAEPLVPTETPAQAQTRQRKHTELCRLHLVHHNCQFESDCWFAHGINELRPIIRNGRYKTRPCRTFARSQKCRYGTRCHYIHELSAEDLVRQTFTLSEIISEDQHSVSNMILAGDGQSHQADQGPNGEMGLSVATGSEGDLENEEDRGKDRDQRRGSRSSSTIESPETTSPTAVAPDMSLASPKPIRELPMRSPWSLNKINPNRQGRRPSYPPASVPNSRKYLPESLIPHPLTSEPGKSFNPIHPHYNPSGVPPHHHQSHHSGYTLEWSSPYWQSATPSTHQTHHPTQPVLSSNMAHQPSQGANYNPAPHNNTAPHQHHPHSQSSYNYAQYSDQGPYGHHGTQDFLSQGHPSQSAHSYKTLNQPSPAYAPRNQQDYRQQQHPNYPHNARTQPRSAAPMNHTFSSNITSSIDELSEDFHALGLDQNYLEGGHYDSFQSHDEGPQYETQREVEHVPRHIQQQVKARLQSPYNPSPSAYQKHHQSHPQAPHHQHHAQQHAHGRGNYKSHWESQNHQHHYQRNTVRRASDSSVPELSWSSFFNVENSYRPDIWSPATSYLSLGASDMSSPESANSTPQLGSESHPALLSKAPNARGSIWD